MGLKQSIEDNSLVFFLGALITGFAAGWAAYSGVQSASNVVPVPASKAKLLEGDTVERLQEAESEVATLRNQILQNRPTNGNYISNVTLSPRNSSVLSPTDHIVVDFDYVVAPGQKADIFAKPGGTANGSFEPSHTLEGTGHSSRWVSLNSPGKMIDIRIVMESETGDELYKMTFPAQYTYQ